MASSVGVHYRLHLRGVRPGLGVSPTTTTAAAARPPPYRSRARRLTGTHQSANEKRGKRFASWFGGCHRLVAEHTRSGERAESSIGLRFTIETAMTEWRRRLLDRLWRVGGADVVI